MKITLRDGRILQDHATTSVGYASSSEPLIHFGLGDETIVSRMEIHWPGAGTQVLTDLKADRVIEIQEAGGPQF